jgi:hypothetical protein
MARNYAQFTTAIWRPGDDFGRLTRNAQWVYFMLATQPDISAAGVLSLNVRRWSGRSIDGSKQDVIDGLQELSTQRFVAYDYETEEVLIRAFIKSDGGYSNSKRKPVIERAVKDVESPALRKVLTDELTKLGLPAEWLSDSPSDAHRMAYPQDGDKPPEESEETAFTQVDSLSDSLSDATCRFDGVVVTKALVVVPQPSTRIPQPVPPPADPAGAASAQGELPGMPVVKNESVIETDDQRAWRLARAWHAECPGRNIPVVPHGKGDPAMKLKNLLAGYLAAKCSEEDVTESLRRCDEAIPSRSGMDRALKAIQRARADEQPGSSVMPLNAPHAGARPGYGAPAPRSPADQRLVDAQPLYAKYKQEEQERENARG